MSTREIVCSVFYSVGFTGALVSGFNLGFTNDHLPPLAFVIALLFVVIGVVCLIADIFLKQSKRIHIIGLCANFVLVLYTYSLTLR